MAAVRPLHRRRRGGGRVRLICDTELASYRRDALERVRIGIAHILYRRVAAGGDRRAALAAMGAFYARTTQAAREETLDVRRATELVIAARNAERAGAAARPDTDTCLILALNRLGCAIVRESREAGGRDGERGAPLGWVMTRLAEAGLAPRLRELLGSGTV